MPEEDEDLDEYDRARASDMEERPIYIAEREEKEEEKEEPDIQEVAA